MAAARALGSSSRTLATSPDGRPRQPSPPARTLRPGGSRPLGALQSPLEGAFGLGEISVPGECDTEETRNREPSSLRAQDPNVRGWCPGSVVRLQASGRPCVQLNMVTVEIATTALVVSGANDCRRGRPRSGARPSGDIRRPPRRPRRQQVSNRRRRGWRTRGLEGAADCKGMAQARERPTPTQGGIGAQPSQPPARTTTHAWLGGLVFAAPAPARVVAAEPRRGRQGQVSVRWLPPPGGVGTVSEPTVRELRLVVTADDYDAALCFYRDANPAVGTDRPLPPALRQPSPSRQDRRRSALAEAGWPQEWRRAGLVGNLRPWLPSRGRTNRAIGSPGHGMPGPADKTGS